MKNARVVCFVLLAAASLVAPGVGVPPTQAADPPAAGTAGAVGDTLAAARAAMSRRNMIHARRMLQAATAAARTDVERAEAERVQTLYDSLTEFWKAVAQAAGQLQVADELQVSGTLAAVVQAEPRSLTLRIEGQNVTYTPQQLPANVAVALMDRVARPGDPVANLHIGSFYAVDRLGDREQARQRWKKAGEAGQTLLPELDLDPAAQAAAAARGSAPPKRLPVPEPQVVSKLVRELQAGEPPARTPQARYDAVRKAFDAAEAFDGPPEKRYAMYERARSMAVAVGDPELFLTVIDSLGYYFEVDAFVLKADALVTAAKGRDASFREQILKAALELYDSHPEKSEAKTKLHTMLLGAARATRNAPLLKRLEAEKPKRP